MNKLKTYLHGWDVRCSIGLKGIKLLSLTFLLFLSILNTAINIPTASAQSSGSLHPEDSAKVYQAYWAFYWCNSGSTWRNTLSSSELRKGDIISNQSTQYRPTFLRASSNGMGNCHNERNMGPMFRDMGISDPLEFLASSHQFNGRSVRIYNLDGNSYRLNSDLSSGDINAILGNYLRELHGTSFTGQRMDPNIAYFVLKAHVLAECIEEENVSTSAGGTEIRLVNNSGEVETITALIRNNSYDVAYGVGRDASSERRGSNLNCRDMAATLNSRADGAVQAIQFWRAANPDAEIPADNSTVTTEEDNSCETNSGVLGWIMCPVAGVLDSIVGFLDEQIRGQLHLREDYFRDNGNGNPVKDSWTQLRNIAYVILVPIMLVMVIGTALGFEVFSAYTIQKALPRMAIAVIFIALSWYICLFMVDLFNVMGAGIKGLITGPFSISNDQSPLKAALTSAEVTSQGSNTLESISSGVTTGGLAIAGTAAAFATGALSLGIIGSTLATAALVLGGVFLLLVARQIILIALFLLAPLAILSWIFPGNDKMWKLWWGSFSKLLMLFPLIMLLLGVGEVFAHITGAARSAAGQDKLVTTVIVIGSFIMPFFFIPFAFKWAGGVFGNLAGMVNDRERGMLDRLKKGRSESRSQGWQRFKTGTGTGFAQRNRIARGVGTRLGAGVGGGKGVFGFGEKGRARMDQMNRQNAIDQIMKNPAWNGVNQDDNALHAGILMEDMSKQEAIAALVQQRGLSQAEAERAAAAWGASGLGGRAAAIAAAQQLVSTGTGYNNLSDMTKTLARASGGNASTATALAGFANAETKKVGRNDLAPGFSTANSLTQGWLDEGGRLRETNTASKASWTEAHDQTWRSGSLYQLANGKPKQMEAFADHWTKEYEDSVRLGDSERAVVASRALEEMREMQSNATGENSEIIRRALERREAFDGSYAQNQGNAAQQTTGSPNTPGGTAAGYQSEEAASQYIADIKTRSRQGARVYQRPDPNNMT